MFRKKCDFRAVQRCALCRSRQELSNAYFLAKFRFDTAENEPSKVPQGSGTFAAAQDPFTVLGVPGGYKCGAEVRKCCKMSIYKFTFKDRLRFDREGVFQRVVQRPYVFCFFEFTSPPLSVDARFFQPRSRAGRAARR